MTDESLAPDVPEPADVEDGLDPQAPEEPEPSPPPAPDDGLDETLRRFDDRLEEAQRLLARQADLGERLHAENQRLRQGELRTAQLPLVRDVLRLHDDVARMADATSGDAQRDLAIVRESLVDALQRNGVVDCSPQPGSPFDSARHSAVGVVTTSDPAQDRAIVETVRPGFAWDDGQLIRVAQVRVAKHQPHADEPDGVESATSTAGSEDHCGD